MPKIIIHYDEDKQQIVLSGAVNELNNNRYAIRAIKDYLNPIFNDNKIIVSLNNKQPIEILSKMHEILKKYGFEEDKDIVSNKIVENFYEEEKNFQLFSQNAFDIRNNHCNKEGFFKFTESLKNNLPNRNLYELQLLSAYHLAFSRNACNFSVPGAGKTSIVYGAYAYLKNLQPSEGKKVDKLLIISPLSAFGPWESEYYECFGKYPTTKRLLSSMSKQDKINYLYSNTISELNLISYRSVSSLKDALAYFLKNNKTMVVLDEAHKIKNTSGGMDAQAILELAEHCESRVVLTGTPAPNGYEDLYNLFKFIWPAKNIIGYQVNQLRDMTDKKDENRINNLTSSIAPFFIRIKKSDLGIPAPIINPAISVKMGNVQRLIYDYIEKKYMESIMQNKEYDFATKFKAQLLGAKLIRLMQAATNPSLLKLPLNNFLDEEDISSSNIDIIDDSKLMKQILDYDELEIPQKFVVTKDLIEKIINSGGKIVVWASFVQTILDFKNYLKTNGINSQELYGKIPVEKQGVEDESESVLELTREKIIKEFQKDDCPYKVLIANPFAVAESISLHKCCHNAIYLERTFNAAHFMQSKDRIHRYDPSPTYETNYYFILSEDSIDETIDERLNFKEKRMLEILEKMPIPLFDNVNEEMGDEDIKSLIRNYVRRTKKT